MNLISEVVALRGLVQRDAGQSERSSHFEKKDAPFPYRVQMPDQSVYFKRRAHIPSVKRVELVFHHCGSVTRTAKR